MTRRRRRFHGNTKCHRTHFTESRLLNSLFDFLKSFEKILFSFSTMIYFQSFHVFLFNNDLLSVFLKRQDHLVIIINYLISEYYNNFLGISIDQWRCAIYVVFINIYCGFPIVGRYTLLWFKLVNIVCSGIKQLIAHSTNDTQ